MRRSSGAVVSAHPLASEAGALVLRRGGNAVDAAVATGLMIGVAEPAFSGIGGGGFALVHLASGEDVAYDYRETAPRGASAEMFADMGRGDRMDDENRIGPLAVATPGMIAGYARMLEEHGRMKFADVAKYATGSARSGIVGKRLSDSMLRTNNLGALSKIRRFQGSERTLVGGRKSRPRLVRKMTRLSETLSGLARQGPESFYSGDIPSKTSRFLRKLGGILSAEDFESYSVKDRKPVTGEFDGLKVVSMPPPSAGGTLLIQGFNLVGRLGQGRWPFEGPDRLQATAGVLNLMLSQKKHFGDPDFVDVDTGKFLSGTTVDRLAERIESGSAGLTGATGRKEVGSTSHFCVSDEFGNVVSATETIECYFGSGVVVPETGILMNDEMHDFSVTPGMPNSVAPGKRPASSMSPTILFRDGEPFLSVGGAGSERIITSVFQVILNVVRGGMSLPRALSAPRIHPAGDSLMVEGGQSRAELAALKRKRGDLRELRPHDLYFGGVQAIEFIQGKLVASADPRRLGRPSLP